MVSTSRLLADNPREAHHHWRLIGPELLGRGLQEGHQDRDQQDVVPQGGLQGSPEGVGAGLDIDLGQTGAVGRISQRCRFSGMREGIAQLAQSRESPFNRGVDQAQTASEGDLPVMLVRREGESFVALLRRLDRSIGKAWDNETIIDEVNG